MTVSHHALSAIRPDFLWGAATAAYQVEGAARENGKGESIWDVFSHTPGRMRNGDTGDIAADHYHRYADDADLMRYLGMNAYRFSIAWTRVQPDGKGAINPAGLDHYERVVDALLARDISPMATLFHWDLPQTLEQEGGWYSRETALRFADYSEAVLGRLGDRVPHWLTLNEPWTVVSQGYCRGEHAPGYADYWRAGAAIHHMMLGHGMALERFRALRAPGSQIGITHIMSLVTPWSSSEADARAAALLDAERNTVYLNPMFKGEYPSVVKNLFPDLFNPEVVRDGDLDLISQPVDYLGVNYYLNQLARADSGVPQLGVQVIEPAGPMMTTHTAIKPEGLYTCIRRITEEYTDVPQYVTEVGLCLPDYMDPEGQVNDPDRIAYLRTCIEGIGKACAEGSDVRGLYVWSLLDNLEWHQGYLPRFGLLHVDFGTQQRTPKSSALWYRDTIAAHRSLG